MPEQGPPPWLSDSEWKKLGQIIDRINACFIDLENLIGTTAETDELEVAIQGLEEVWKKN